MATLTIIGQPTTIVPANNPIEYKVRVSPAGSTPKVSISIYQASPMALVAQWSQQIDHGATDVFTFRVEPIIQELLAYNLRQPTEYGTLEAPKCVVGFYCTFKNHTQTLSQTSSTVFAINACLQPHEAPSLSAFVMDGTAPKQFLTQAPPTKEISLNDSEMLSLALNTSTGLVARVRRYLYGNPTATVSNLALPGALLGKKRLDIGIGPKNLNQPSSGVITTGHSHYDVSIVSSTSQNFFLDMDNGTMEANLNGFLAGPGFTTYTHSIARARRGSRSVLVNFSNGPSNGSYHVGWQGATMLPLAQYATYTFTCYAYCEGTVATANPPQMRITAEGLADATIVYNSTWQAGALNQWVQLRTTVTTKQDTTARFVVEKAGTWAGLSVYFDDANIAGIRAFSETRRYNIVGSTNKHATRIHFLNRLGAMDSYTLQGNERRNIKTENTTFNQIRPVGFAPTARGKAVLQKNANIRLTCSSEALRPDEMQWLEELLTSPAVYVQQADLMLPVIVRDGEFEVVDPTKNIHRLRIELEFANDLVLQRG